MFTVALCCTVLDIISQYNKVPITKYDVMQQSTALNRVEQNKIGWSSVKRRASQIPARI